VFGVCILYAVVLCSFHVVTEDAVFLSMFDKQDNNLHHHSIVQRYPELFECLARAFVLSCVGGVVSLM
jgi:hypothetical protein